MQFICLITKGQLRTKNNKKQKTYNSNPQTKNRINTHILTINRLLTKLQYLSELQMSQIIKHTQL